MTRVQLKQLQPTHQLLFNVLLVTRSSKYLRSQALANSGTGFLDARGRLRAYERAGFRRHRSSGRRGGERLFVGVSIFDVPAINYIYG